MPVKLDHQLHYLTISTIKVSQMSWVPLSDLIRSNIISLSEVSCTMLKMHFPFEVLFFRLSDFQMNNFIFPHFHSLSLSLTLFCLYVNGCPR